MVRFSRASSILGGAAAVAIVAVAPAAAGPCAFDVIDATKGQVLAHPSDGRIGATYGQRMHPIQKRPRPHLGIDYLADAGSPVKAAAAGEVVSAGQNGDFGIQVVIRHGERFEAAYDHLASVADGLKPGSCVRRGQVIGAVGQTGAVTSPHLMFQVSVDDRYLDPERLLPPIPPERFADKKTQ